MRASSPRYSGGQMTRGLSLTTPRVAGALRLPPITQPSQQLCNQALKVSGRQTLRHKAVYLAGMRIMTDADTQGGRAMTHA